MEETYTFIARSAENPHRIVTFTLQDHSLAVGLGPLLEQTTSSLEEDHEGEQREESKAITQIWFQPLAISLLGLGKDPFPLAGEMRKSV